MSEGQSLPEELAQLEKELAALPRPDPSVGLRGRVLAAVRHEARAPSPAAGRGSFVSFAAAVAALLLACMNLSMSAANNMDWDVWGSADRRVDVASQALQLRQLLPELSQQEAAQIAPTMDLRRPLRLVPLINGRRPWTAALALPETEAFQKEPNHGIRTAVD
jgi:hypothetical protein